MPSSYKYLDVIASLFVAILIVSNIASSAKIVDVGFSLFGIPLVFDGGTLLFPLAYVLGDVLTEVYGFKAARRVIWTGFAALGLSAMVFFLLRILPPEAAWEAETGSAAYNAVLGGMSSGGIVLASLAAYLAGEFSNAVVLSKLKIKMKGRLLWVRTIGSTLVGEMLDTVIFVLIATAAGVFGWSLFWPLVITNYLLKCGIEAVMTPLTYLLSRFLKRKEGIDVYDLGVKYTLI
ncbi:MAG: queuosine precursor transporter [Treponema sp.]|nr:queuosine precursor transporter [Treponema sp.]